MHILEQKCKQTRCGMFSISPGKITWLYSVSGEKLFWKYGDPTCEACVLLHWIDPSKTYCFILYNHPVENNLKTFTDITTS